MPNKIRLALALLLVLFFSEVNITLLDIDFCRRKALCLKNTINLI